MRRLRPRARRLRLAAVSAATVVYASWVRPRMRSWGATQAETTRSFPGDELVPDPNGGDDGHDPASTTGEGLALAGADGRGPGGWYSWDWVDNDGEPSADRIEPEWQDLDVGQHLYRAPKGPTNWWTVVIVEPNRTLVMQTSYGLLGRSFDPRTDAVPWASTLGTWAFYLNEALDGRTRLVVRTRNRSRPPLLTLPLALLVGEPVHLIMQTRQFHNLRTRLIARSTAPGR